MRFMVSQCLKRVQRDLVSVLSAFRRTVHQSLKRVTESLKRVHHDLAASPRLSTCPAVGDALGSPPRAEELRLALCKRILRHVVGGIQGAGFCVSLQSLQTPKTRNDTNIRCKSRRPQTSPRKMTLICLPRFAGSTRSWRQTATIIQPEPREGRGNSTGPSDASPYSASSSA